VTAKDICYAKS